MEKRIEQGGQRHMLEPEKIFDNQIEHADIFKELQFEFTIGRL